MHSKMQITYIDYNFIHVDNSTSDCYSYFIPYSLNS